MAAACRGCRGGSGRSGRVHSVVASGHGLPGVVASLPPRQRPRAVVDGEAQIVLDGIAWTYPCPKRSCYGWFFLQLVPDSPSFVCGIAARWRHACSSGTMFASSATVSLLLCFFTVCFVRRRVVCCFVFLERQLLLFNQRLFITYDGPDYIRDYIKPAGTTIMFRRSSQDMSCLIT